MPPELDEFVGITQPVSVEVVQLKLTGAVLVMQDECGTGHVEPVAAGSDCTACTSRVLPALL
jgi:hypothetical protein